MDFRVLPRIHGGAVQMVGPGSSWLLSLPGGAAEGAVLAGDEVRWIVERNGVARVRGCSLSTATSVAPGIKKLLVFAGNGQSQESARNARPVIHGTPVAEGRAFRFAGGVRPLGPQSPPERDAEADRAGLDDLVPLAEMVQATDGETRYSSFATALLPHLPADVGVLCFTAAIGSQPYQELGPGQEPFFNVAHYLGRARTICGMLGLEMEVGGFFWRQGGANKGDSLGTYLGYMREYHDACQIAAQGVGTPAAPLFLSQMTHNSSLEMTVARAQLQASLDPTRQIVCMYPEYFLPSCADEHSGDPNIPNDTTHIAAIGQAWSGLYDAETVRLVRAGAKPEPLRVTSAARANSIVTLGFNLGAVGVEGPIVVGSHIVAPAAPGGFAWSDDGNGNAVTVTNVEPVFGGTKLRVYLSAIPTGTGQRLAIANSATAEQPSWHGPVNGARCTIRDSRAGGAVIAGRTLTLHNHLSVDVLDL